MRGDNFGEGDGVADDRSALQAAINAARTANKTLILPAGTYRITDFLDWACGEFRSRDRQAAGAGLL